LKVTDLYMTALQLALDFTILYIGSRILCSCRKAMRRNFSSSSIDF
jgi:hypothetical protein